MPRPPFEASTCLPCLLPFCRPTPLDGCSATDYCLTRSTLFSGGKSLHATSEHCHQMNTADKHALDMQPKREQKMKCFLPVYLDKPQTLRLPSIDNGMYRVFFLTRPPLKVLSVRLHSKSHQKSSKCQNLLTGWHLELLGGGELKKTPCMCLVVSNRERFVNMDISMG